MLHEFIGGMCFGAGVAVALIVLQPFNILGERLESAVRNLLG